MQLNHRLAIVGLVVFVLCTTNTKEAASTPEALLSASVTSQPEIPPKPRCFEMAVRVASRSDLALYEVCLLAERTEIKIAILDDITGVCWAESGPDAPFLEIGTETYAFLGGEGYEPCDTRTDVFKGHVFALNFEPIPLDTAGFDFIEGESGRVGLSGFWNFLGVELR